MVVRSARCVPEAALECDPRYARGGPPRREFAVRDPQGRGGCREDCPGRRRRRLARSSTATSSTFAYAARDAIPSRPHARPGARSRAPVRTCCACPWAPSVMPRCSAFKAAREVQGCKPSTINRNVTTLLAAVRMVRPELRAEGALWQGGRSRPLAGPGGGAARTRHDAGAVPPHRQARGANPDAPVGDRPAPTRAGPPRGWPAPAAADQDRPAPRDPLRGGTGDPSRGPEWRRQALQP